MSTDQSQINKEASEDAAKLLAEIEAGDTQNDTTTKSKGDTEKTSEETGQKVAEAENEEITQAHGKDDDDSKDATEKKGKNREDRRRDRNDHREDNYRGGGRGRGRGRGRGGHSNTGRDNVKSVLVKEEKSSDPDAIRKQVEFYFSDSNLPMDLFLFNKVGGNENNPVELDIICTFKRMRHFEPREAIVEALRSSKTLNLVDDDTKVQRKNPLPKSSGDDINVDHVRVYEDKAQPRSVYVKGFGQEQPTTQFDIEAFFAEFGPTNAIRLRRADDKLFKGSVFAEFETEELARNFLELDPKPRFKDRDLQIMSKKEYCDKKVDDIKAGKIKPGADRGHNDRRGRGGRFSGRGGRRDDKRDDDRDWRTRRDEDRKTGFRDDKRRDHKGKGTGANRERRKSVEKDERGIPVVKASADMDRDKAKQEALAKARAAVEADNKEANGADKSEVNGATAEAVKTDDAGKKREREEDAAQTEGPPTKKQDVKAEV